jgi:deazaflavin-dependent oxidoreductase (nitroreductase family)
MASWPFSDDRLRAMYPAGRADATARRLARTWAGVFSLGLAPARWVTLEVAGRKSGQPARYPLGMADLDRQWFLVSMLGERCSWVQNVRAAHGRVIIRHGRAVACTLAEVPAGDRPPVLKRYLQKVPGARPHIPVSQDAQITEFAAIAPRYPVFLVTPNVRGSGFAAGRAAEPGGRQKKTREREVTAEDSGVSLPRQPRSRRSPRRRHWWRWLLAAAAALAIVLVGAVVLYVTSEAPAPALTLPAGPVRPPAGPLDGTWHVASGSAAGFRLQQTVLGLGIYIGGQTSAVTGAVVLSGDKVISATLRIQLTAIKVSGKTQPQFGASLGISQHPVATFTLSAPVALSPAFVAGGTATVRTTGQLAMNGITHLATVVLAARRDGTVLQAAGAIPVTFAYWDIRQPAGFGFIGSLADHGDAEFRLLLRRASSLP